MSIHYKAISHLDKAIKLADRGEAEDLIYAALELRFSIERLIYQFQPYYRDEIPDELFDEWRPQLILDAMVEANPMLRHSHDVNMASENSDGEPTTWFRMGSQKGLSPKHIRAAYHRLSNFLHTPFGDGERDPAKLRRSVETVIALLEPYREASIISNFDVRYTVTCECGRRILRRKSAVEKSPFARCPNSCCRVLYRFVSETGNDSEWEKVTQEFVCPKCKTKTYFAVTQMEAGARLRCEACQAITRLEPALFARLEVQAGTNCAAETPKPYFASKNVDEFRPAQLTALGRGRPSARGRDDRTPFECISRCAEECGRLRPRPSRRPASMVRIRRTGSRSEASLAVVRTQRRGLGMRASRLRFHAPVR